MAQVDGVALEFNSRCTHLVPPIIHSLDNIPLHFVPLSNRSTSVSSLHPHHMLPKNVSFTKKMSNNMLLFLYLFFNLLMNVAAQTTQSISTTGTLQATQFECPDNCTCLRREFERENLEN